MLLVFGIIGCSHLNHPATPNAGSIAFIKPGKTTKAEVLQKFGKPNWEWEQERVIAYRWEDMGEASRFNREQMSSPSLSQWAFCIAFDQDNIVTHHNLFNAPDSEALKKKVQHWIELQQR